jgi:hypothetical protein
MVFPATWWSSTVTSGDGTTVRCTRSYKWSRSFWVLAVEPGDRQLILSVPEPPSMSRDQAIFVGRATGASLSQYAVVLEIDGSGSGFSGAASSSDR